MVAFGPFSRIVHIPKCSLVCSASWSSCYRLTCRQPPFKMALLSCLFLPEVPSLVPHTPCRLHPGASREQGLFGAAQHLVLMAAPGQAPLAHLLARRLTGEQGPASDVLRRVRPLRRHFRLNRLRFCPIWTREPQVRSQGRCLMFSKSRAG